jgi:hypothetical protein
VKSLHAEKAAVEQSQEVLEGGKKEAEEKVRDLEKRIKVCLPAFDNGALFCMLPCRKVLRKYLVCQETVRGYLYQLLLFDETEGDSVRALVGVFSNIPGKKRDHIGHGRGSVTLIKICSGTVTLMGKRPGSKLAKWTDGLRDSAYVQAACVLIGLSAVWA